MHHQDGRSMSEWPGKWPDQPHQPPFGTPEVRIAGCTSRLACRKGGEARVFKPDRESPGESRLNPWK